MEQTKTITENKESKNLVLLTDYCGIYQCLDQLPKTVIKKEVGRDYVERRLTSQHISIIIHNKKLLKDKYDETREKEQILRNSLAEKSSRMESRTEKPKEFFELRKQVAEIANEINMIGLEKVELPEFEKIPESELRALEFIDNTHIQYLWDYLVDFKR